MYMLHLVQPFICVWIFSCIHLLFTVNVNDDANISLRQTHVAQERREALGGEMTCPRKLSLPVSQIAETGLLLPHPPAFLHDTPPLPFPYVPTPWSCTCRDILAPESSEIGTRGHNPGFTLLGPHHSLCAKKCMTMTCFPLIHQMWMKCLQCARHILGTARKHREMTRCEFLQVRGVSLACCLLGPRRVLRTQQVFDKCLSGECRAEWEQEPGDPCTHWCWALSRPRPCQKGRLSLIGLFRKGSGELWLVFWGSSSQACLQAATEKPLSLCLADHLRPC